MLTTDLTDSMGVFQGVHPFNPFNPLLNIPSSRNPFNPFNPLLILPKQSCCCGGKDTSATIFRTQRICVDLCNLWEALLSSRFCGFCAICGRFSSAAGSVNSVQSVGEYTHPNFCGFRGFCGKPPAGAGCVRSFLRSRGRRRRRIPARYTCVR